MAKARRGGDRPEMKSTGEAMGIDREFAPAFTRRCWLPGGAEVRGDPRQCCRRDKAETLRSSAPGTDGLPTLRDRGTAAMIEHNGIPVKMVTKRIGQGRRTCSDVILDGTVQGSSTRRAGETEMLDGFQIRRSEPKGILHHLDRHCRCSRPRIWSGRRVPIQSNLCHTTARGSPCSTNVA